MEFRPFVPPVLPLNLLMFGQQGAGKTTTCASLLREPTMLLYSSVLESHSAGYMSKGASIYPGAKPENLYAFSIDKCQDADKHVIPSAAKWVVGATLSPEQSMMKLHAYLDAVKGGFFKSVVLDSMSSILGIAKQTSDFRSFCSTDKGKHNSFQESPALQAAFNDIFAKLKVLNEDHLVKCVTLCAASASEINQETMSAEVISPTLPFFGLVQNLVLLFPDIAAVTKDPIGGYSRSLRFSIGINRASKGLTDKKVTKFVDVTPRLRCAPLDVPIDALPPDLYNIEKNVDMVVEAYRSSDK